MIISRTPFRVSFFGGGSDFPFWFRKYGGAVIGMAIDKYCYITCRKLPPFFEYRHRIVYSTVEMVKTNGEIKHPAIRAVLQTLDMDEGYEIHHDGDLPARSGLGSSSAFTVGFVNTMKALKGEIISKRELADQAIHIEQEVLQESVGCQDQILTAHGGLNKIEFLPEETYSVTPIIMNKEKVADFQNHLMLFFTGFSRFSSEIAKVSLANLEKRKSEIDAMRKMVDEAALLLQGERFSMKIFGEMLHEYWMHKRQISEKVSSPVIDEIYQAGMDAGAYGGKLLGAGGGGFMLFVVRPDLQPKFCERLKKLVHVSLRIDYSGSRIVIYEPNNFQ